MKLDDPITEMTQFLCSASAQKSHALADHPKKPTVVAACVVLMIFLRSRAFAQWLLDGLLSLGQLHAPHVFHLLCVYGSDDPSRQRFLRQKHLGNGKVYTYNADLTG